MGYAPENTLRSVRKALALGAPCIEIDVYCVEGHLVVIHDDRLDRTTNGRGLVMDQTFDYLRSLDAGDGDRIPTLDEVCETIKGRAGLNIELKGPETAEPVAAFIAGLVDAGWDKNTFVVSSFNPQALLTSRQLDADIRIGVITGSAPPDHIDFAAAINAFSVHPNFVNVHPALVEDVHVRGMKMYAYTVNERDDIARMHAMGVDGVFTNYPDRVLDHYAQGEGSGFWIGR